MSSWVHCKCGKRIGTGSFPNTYVSRIITEKKYDEITDPVDRNKIAVLFLSGDILIVCPQCNRLIICRKETNEIEYYHVEKDL